MRGCASRDAAHRIAKTVAESSLVKTAITGADPNWGRIVSAAIRDHRDTHVELSFAEGAGEARFWTSDLTCDYVRFNSEYTT